MATPTAVRSLLGDQELHRRLGRRCPTRPKADPRLAKVTVGQLLTMTSGLAGDDRGPDSDLDLLVRLLESPDWVRLILER